MPMTPHLTPNNPLPQQDNSGPIGPDDTAERVTLYYTLRALQKIVMRKHGMGPLFEGDLSQLSSRDLTAMIEVMRELAHLPPG